jgi:2-oxoglutarate ferredoxin oxidoreductase subunit gamma
MLKRTEILISGFGGQGVVRLGQILGLAAVYQGFHTTMLISHGTETRGGYVRSQVVISGAPIDSPVIEHSDYFCALSDIAYHKFKNLSAGGIILYDPDTVQPDLAHSSKQVPVRAGNIAKTELGEKVFANTVFLGVLSWFLTDILEKETIVTAMLERISRYHEQNRRAFQTGYDFGVGLTI